MLIIADENIPYAREAFGTLGEVRTISGRSVTPDAIRDAELLIVRSVTRVDRALLEGSRVRFLGTATIGTDHVDLDYLREAGIDFAAAPGTNADSVAEYVVAALLTLAERQGRSLAGASIGIVGVGNVGSRVDAKCRILEMTTVLNDPPLRDQTGDPKYRPLEEALDCDFVTFHVPLDRAGPYPTYHLADADRLRRFRPTAALLNTSRGAVVDNPALLKALRTGGLSAAVLDVWEGEPAIDLELLDVVALGTPHIAGYSIEGKVAGLEMVYRAACAFLDREPAWSADEQLPSPDEADLTVAPNASPEEMLRAAVLRAYPIQADDAALRAIGDLPTEERSAYFDRLRKEYPERRDWRNYTVHGATDGNVKRKLDGLGFRTD